MINKILNAVKIIGLFNLCLYIIKLFSSNFLFDYLFIVTNIIDNIYYVMKDYKFWLLIFLFIISIKDRYNQIYFIMILFFTIILHINHIPDQLSVMLLEIVILMSIKLFYRNIVNLTFKLEILNKKYKFVKYGILSMLFFVPIFPEYTYKLIMILFFLTLVCFNSGMIYKLKLKLNEKYIFIIFIFIILQILSILFTRFNVEVLTPYIMAIVVLFISLVNFDDINDIKIAINIFIFAMFISELTSYGIIFGLWHTTVGSVNNPTPFIHNHSEYALFLLITIFWLFKLFINEKSIIKKIFYFTFFLTATLNLFFNSSRSAYINYFIILIFTLYYYRSLLKQYFKYVLLVFIGLIIFLFNNNMVYSRLKVGFNNLQNTYKFQKYNSSWGSRVMAYEIGFDLIKEKPIFGNGNGNIKEKSEKYVKQYKMQNQIYYNKYINKVFHNIYLQVFVEFGLLGFCLYILFWIVLLKEYYGEYDYFFKTLILGYMGVSLFTGIYTHIMYWSVLMIFIVLFNLNKKRIMNEK